MPVRVCLWGVAGYLAFAASAFALFQLGGVDPHDPPSLPLLVGGGGGGGLAAFGAGWLATRRTRPARGAAGIVAGLMVLSGIASMAAQPGAGSVWSQLVTVFVFAPAALAGGWLARSHRRIIRRE